MELPAVAITLDAVLGLINEGFALVVEEKQAFLVEAAGLDRKNIPVPLWLGEQAAANLRRLEEKEVAAVCRPLHSEKVRARKVYGAHPHES